MGDYILLKKRYLFFIMIIFLFIISAVNAEEIDNNVEDNQLSVDIDATYQISNFENNLSLTNGKDNNEKTSDEILSNSNMDSNLIGVDEIEIYFDASAKTNGDGSKSNPYKYINQNTLNVNSGKDITAYFADGVYKLNTPFKINSNVVLIGESTENTIFNSVLSNKYDFEIMQDYSLEIKNISINHINIQNHGTLKAINTNFENSVSFTGDNAPSTNNTKNYGSSYGGVIICDPIGVSIPYIFLNNCIFNNNSAYCGGVISLKNSRLVMFNSKFSNSQAQHQGGVIYAFNSAMFIQGADFNLSGASYGGVIYCEYSAVDLEYTNSYSSETYSFGGAIASRYSDINITSCDFEKCLSLTDAGGAIYNYIGNLNIEDSSFSSGRAEFGGVIANLDSNLTVSSSYFLNNEAGDGGVIYNMYGNMFISNNDFYVSCAVLGSVISSEFSDSLFIIDNDFLFHTIEYGGSCISIDVPTEDIYLKGNHFENAYRYYIELTGYLNDEKVTLRSNVLTYVLSNDGIYRFHDYGKYMDSSGGFSNLTLSVWDSMSPYESTIFGNYNDTFIVFSGFDGSFNNIRNPFLKYYVCDMGDNILYDEVIVFDDFFNESNFASLKFIHYMLDMPDTRIPVEYSNVPLINSSLSDLNYIPVSYDSRDYGYITPVKNQLNGGNCWAFAGIATLEACIKKITNITYDFSEENAKNTMASFSKTGLNMLPNTGGYDSMILGYFTNWFGPILEEKDDYDDLSSLSFVYYPSDFHIQNIYFLPERNGGLNDDLYKKAIMDYGAVSIGFNWLDLYSATIFDWDDDYNNYDSFGVYGEGAWIYKNLSNGDWQDNGLGYLSYSNVYNDSYKKIIMDTGSVDVTFYPPNFHAVSLVGWDDNFNNMDSLGQYAKGAWIFKNSWGTDWGDNGFGYLSYDTPFESDEYANCYAYTFVFNKNDYYVSVNQADYLIPTDFKSNLGPIYCDVKVVKSIKSKNLTEIYDKQFQSQHLHIDVENYTANINFLDDGLSDLDDGLSAFATYFKVPTNYEVSIFNATNGDLLLNQKGYSQAGYYTIPFNKNIEMNPGDEVWVRIGYCNDGLNYLPISQIDRLTKSHYLKDYAFYSYDGGKTFFDLSDLDDNYQEPCIQIFSSISEDHSCLFDMDISKFDNINTGENVTINITIRDVNSTLSYYYKNVTIEKAEGTLVTLYINGKYYYAKIHDGKASLNLNFDKPGNYELTAEYCSNRYKSDVVGFNFTVNKIDTRTNISSTKNANNVTLIASVNSKAASGNVVFNVNGTEYSAEIIGGKATYTLYNLDAGSYTAKATYKGNAMYKLSNSKSISFNIEKNKFDVSAFDLIKYYKGPERFVVTVKDKDNKFVVGKNVTITLNGVPYIRTTNSNGQASIGINLNSGKYGITSEFEGIEVKSTITVKSTVSGKDISKIFRNGTQYYATFVDTGGNLLKNTAIKFNINGVFYTRTTNDEGVARMNINLNPGEYIITAENPNSGEQYSNLIKVLPCIVEVHDLTKFYKNASRLTFKLLDDQGRPVGAGVAAKININGVFYERKTNASGYVNMNINLNPGTYIATLEYKGLMASSTVKVLPILEAKDVNMRYRDGTKFEVKLLDGQGKPFAGQTITLNINGVLYNRVTNENGFARLNLNLMAGEYIITSMYENGAAISNKVTIRS